MKILVSFLYFFLVLSCKSEVPPITIYVVEKYRETSKHYFDTIDEAIRMATELRTKQQTHPIIIHVSEGNYYLDDTILITPLLNNLQIIGEGADKVSLKGSKPLELVWEKHSDHIMVSKVDNDLIFDQLFVNGNKQVLARYPNYDENGGHWQGHAADAIAPERLKTWSQPMNAVFHVMHAGEWGGFHYEISEVDVNGEAILKGGHQNNRTSAGLHQKYRMVENVFEELDSPGEWFLDKNMSLLYYWPTDDVDLNNDLIEVTRLKHLIDIKGDESSSVKDILITGIHFEHTQRTIMEDYEPLLRSDWTIYRGGAVFLENAEDVIIKDCEFSNLGGNVIFLSNFNDNVQLTGNHIHDCGASAISFVGSPTAVRSPSFQYADFIEKAALDTVRGPLNNNYPRNCLVDDNLIYRIGRLEKQTAGVEISMAMAISVSNNSIYDVPRAGINVSEGTWGGHIIEYNDVFSTVLESGDHGAFNSWGRDRFWHPDRAVMDAMVEEHPDMPLWDAVETTVIRNNRFRCDHGWDIDLDDGSSNYEIYNNLCLNGGIKLREGFYRTVENNIIINNGFHPHVWFKNSGDIFRRNIVMTDHKDIRLQAWGKEVDYNIFTDEKSLLKSKESGTDTHSVFEMPKFINPEDGDFRVQNNSKAVAIGFKNFPLNSFGVKKPELRALAKTPEIPELLLSSTKGNLHTETMEWLGGYLKNMETLAERSASGLSRTAGVIIVELEANSILDNSALQKGDVIIDGEGQEINGLLDLKKVIQEHTWKGVLNLKVFRNQKDMDLQIQIKK